MTKERRGPGSTSGPLASSTGDEAGLGHEILMGFSGLLDPGPELLTGHEGRVERALGHEVLPLGRLADLLHQLDVVVDRVLLHVGRHEDAAQPEIQIGRASCRESVCKYV